MELLNEEVQEEWNTNLKDLGFPMILPSLSDIRDEFRKFQTRQMEKDEKKQGI